MVLRYRQVNDQNGITKGILQVWVHLDTAYVAVG